MAANDPVILGNGEEHPRYAVSYRPLVDVFDKYVGVATNY